MDVIRIGEKVISRSKIDKVIDAIMELRAMGLSQSEVGDRLGIERTFISRLEGMGEVRKGKSIAVVGFPIKNKNELEKVLHDYGIDYYILMTESERTEFVLSCSGNELINKMMELINKFRSYDTVIVLASDYRSRVIKGMLDNQVIEFDIGKSPIKEDVYVDPEQLTEILKILKG